MKRLAIITLAATALVPASAVAQHGTVSPPVKWEDVPDARLRVQGAPVRVHTQAPAPYVPSHAPARVEMRRTDAPAAGARRHVEVRRSQSAAPIVQGHHGARTEVRHGGHIMHRRVDRAIRRGHHGINRYPNYRRIDRGFVLPQSWWGPRFHIQNWNMYGFSQPMHGSRWVRYYDDALLIDRMGRVHDGRYGMDWDQYGDDWGYDESGIPGQVGDEDFYRDQDGYDRGYRHEQGYARGHRQHVYAHPPVIQHPPYAAYGWGYGYGAGAIVTETTVTTSPTVVSKTYYVDEVVTQRVQKPRRVKRRAPACDCRKPAPVRPYGERG
jgi:Ni/Co efflux regulator RcnB